MQERARLSLFYVWIFKIIKKGGYVLSSRLTTLLNGYKDGLLTIEELIKRLEELSAHTATSDSGESIEIVS